MAASFNDLVAKRNALRNIPGATTTDNQPPAPADEESEKPKKVKNARKKKAESSSESSSSEAEASDSPSEHDSSSSDKEEEEEDNEGIDKSRIIETGRRRASQRAISRFERSHNQKILAEKKRVENERLAKDLQAEIEATEKEATARNGDGPRRKKAKSSVAPEGANRMQRGLCRLVGESRKVPVKTEWKHLSTEEKPSIALQYLCAMGDNGHSLTVSADAIRILDAYIDAIMLRLFQQALYMTWQSSCRGVVYNSETGDALLQINANDAAIKYSTIDKPIFHPHQLASVLAQDTVLCNTLGDVRILGETVQLTLDRATVSKKELEAFQSKHPKTQMGTKGKGEEMALIGARAVIAAYGIDIKI